MMMITRTFQILTLVFSICAICLGTTRLPSFINQIKKERDDARILMEKSHEELSHARRDFLTIEIAKNSEKKALEITKRTQNLLEKNELFSKELSQTIESLKASKAMLEAKNQKLSTDLNFQTSQNHVLRNIVELKNHPPSFPVRPVVTISPPSIIRKK